MKKWLPPPARPRTRRCGFSGVLEFSARCSGAARGVLQGPRRVELPLAASSHVTRASALIGSPVAGNSNWLPDRSVKSSIMRPCKVLS